MKRTLALILSSIVLALSLTGCGGNIQKPETLEEHSFKKPISGLIKALKDKKFLDKTAVITEMTPVTQENSSGDEAKYGGYLEIGAEEGYRFAYKYNDSNVYMELYRYNPDKLNDQAEKIIKSVKSNGKFKLDNSKDEVEAHFSKNKKYLMIYIDNSETDKNKNRKNKVISFFENYEE